MGTEDQSMEQSDVMETSPHSQTNASVPQMGWDRQGMLHGFVGPGGVLPTSTAASGSNTPSLELESLFAASGEQSRPSTSTEPNPNKIQPSHVGGLERSPEAVKYSVTCSRKNLRRLVCSIVDTALSESAPGQDDLVTMSLRLES